MAKRKQQKNDAPGKMMPDDLPFTEDTAPEFGEAEFGTMEIDRQRFVKMDAVGSTFTGKFIRLIDPKKGDAGRTKHPGYLFAEYPTGRLVVLPFNWSIGEKIAEKERADREFWNKTLVRLTLTNIIPKPNDTSVKLYGYQYAALPKGFTVQWDETFPS